ncbi:MAG: PRD domain-containing protein [Anaerorhabdus sp.]
MINSEEIKKIINQRTRDWVDITADDKELIHDYAKSVLSHCEELGIVFDETAGSVFVTHLTTLFNRINENFEMELDQETLSQIDKDLLEISESINDITLKYYKKQLNRTEKFLVATHVGSMRERNREKEEADGKNKNCHCA